MKTRIYIFATILIALMSVTVISCENTLDIIQAYNYKVNVQKYRKDVKINVPVELVLKIESEGSFSDVGYCFSYFLREGNGTLTESTGQTLENNNLYILPEEILKIYYTPKTIGPHSLEVEISDSFHNKKEIIIDLKAE